MWADRISYVGPLACNCGLISLHLQARLKSVAYMLNVICNVYKTYVLTY